jgi:hypothetical protein
MIYKCINPDGTIEVCNSKIDLIDMLLETSLQETLVHDYMINIETRYSEFDEYEWAFKYGIEIAEDNGYKIERKIE